VCVCLRVFVVWYFFGVCVLQKHAFAATMFVRVCAGVRGVACVRFKHVLCWKACQVNDDSLIPRAREVIATNQ